MKKKVGSRKPKLTRSKAVAGPRRSAAGFENTQLENRQARLWATSPKRDFRSSNQAAERAFRKARPQIEELIAWMKADPARLVAMLAESWLAITLLVAMYGGRSGLRRRSQFSAVGSQLSVLSSQFEGVVCVTRRAVPDGVAKDKGLARR